MQDIKKLFRKAYQKARQESFVYGVVGKTNPDTSVSTTVTGRLDYLWVTLADKTAIAARNEAGVPHTMGLEVKLRVEGGEGGPKAHVIVGRSTRGDLSTPTETPASGVFPHAIEEHSDATITAAAAGDVMAHNGTDWIDETPVVTSAGAGDAGKLIRLDAAGHVDATMINDADINLDNVTEGATNKFYTDTEKTKLAGIEAGANLYVHPNHTGDVTSTGDGATAIGTNKVLTAMIADAQITLAKQANLAQSTIIGRAAGAGTGVPQALTATQAAAIVNSVIQNFQNTTNWKASGLDHGLTSWMATDTAMAFLAQSALEGGFWMIAATDVGTRTPYHVMSIVGDTTTTVAAIILEGSKKNGTTKQDLAATEILLDIQNRSTNVFRMYANGDAVMASAAKLAVGPTAALARLHVLEATLGSEVLRLQSTATNDDPTDQYFQGRAATTNATPTTTNTIAIAASNTYHIDVEVISRRTGGSAGAADDAHYYHKAGIYKTVAGAVTLVASPFNTDAGDMAGGGVNLTISSTNVLVQVVGLTNYNITWHVFVRVRKVGT